MYVADPRQDTDTEFDTEFETARIEGERLGEHLAHDHGRMLQEIAGLPLHAIHELEHIEAAMGLLQLRHQHSRSASPRHPLTQRAAAHVRSRRR